MDKNTHEEPRKGLRVSILTGPHSNTIPFTHLTLVGKGVDQVFEVTPHTPAVEIVPGNVEGTVKAVLVDGRNSPASYLAQAGHGEGSDTWSMSSGTYIEGDSRVWELGNHHPIPLHNRYEVTDTRRVR